MSLPEKRVRMAELSVARSPAVLVTIGLGSCIGIAMYDSLHKIGGLVHIMLPVNRKNNKPAKYADTGINTLIEKMVSLGASSINLTAKIAGGAKMFEIAGQNDSMNIGKQNIAAVHKILSEKKIKLLAEDVGQNYGRTMRFFTDNGRVEIKSYQRGTIEL